MFTWQNNQRGMLGSLLAATCTVLTLVVYASESNAIAQATSPVPETVPVQVIVPKFEDVAVYLNGLGTAQADVSIGVTSQIDGVLQSVHFTEGQFVKQGDLLAVIDPRPYQAALDQALAKIRQDEADLENARYLLEKDTTLAAQQIVTQEALHQQRSQVKNLEALLSLDTAAKEAAQVSLSYTQIKSPINGVTGILAIDPGNQLRASSTTAIVTIAQVNPISVVFSLRETDLVEVRKAMITGPVPVTARSVDQISVLGTGTVTLIDNAIDQATGSIRIKSSFPNPDLKLWPGEALSVSLRQTVLPNALTVPSPAVQRGPDGFFVYVINDSGQAEIQKVSVGHAERGRTIITSGLRGSEKVVVTGQYRLSAGVKVQATDYVNPETSDN